MNTTLLTTTFYKSTSETRFQLACQMIGNAVGAEYNMLVVDGSPPDSGVMQALKRIGAQVLPQNAPGMGPSRRQVFQIAADLAGPGIFLWLEPEKVDLVRSVPEIVMPIIRGEADIVIPSRTQKSRDSYPTFQITSEKKANEIYHRLVGRALDPMFGPIAFDNRFGEFFAKCNPTVQFGAVDGYVQLFAPLVAMARGCRVASVPVNFYYPPVQKAEEESVFSEEMLKKRYSQFDQLTVGWELATIALGFPLPTQET